MSKYIFLYHTSMVWLRIFSSKYIKSKRKKQNYFELDLFLIINKIETNIY